MPDQAMGANSKALRVADLGSVAGLWLPFVERRKQPEQKTGILLLIASIGITVTGIFSI